jgi:anoctamin-7
MRLQYRGIMREGVFYEGVWIPGDMFHSLEAVGMNEEFPQTRYAQPYTRVMKYLAGGLPIVTMLSAVIIVTLSILALRLFLQQTSISLAGGLIGGVLNAVSIQLLNALCKLWPCEYVFCRILTQSSFAIFPDKKVAQVLSDWENHRTEQLYDNSLIFKIFLFQFVNSYTSLVYVAFFKNGADLFITGARDSCRFTFTDAPPHPNALGCMDELTLQLATILGTNIVIGQVQEVLLPWLKRKYNRHKHGDAVDSFGQQWEKEASFVDFPGTRDEYMELIIQYG